MNVSLTMVTLQKWYLFAAVQKQVDLSDLYVRTQSFTIIRDTVGVRNTKTTRSIIRETTLSRIEVKEKPINMAFGVGIYAERNKCRYIRIVCLAEDDANNSLFFFLT